MVASALTARVQVPEQATVPMAVAVEVEVVLVVLVVVAVVPVSTLLDRI